MSKNTNNTQENTDQNSPKSFAIMANTLGITESKFVELTNKKESVSTENLSNFSMKIEDENSIGLSQ